MLFDLIFLISFLLQINISILLVIFAVMGLHQLLVSRMIACCVFHNSKSVLSNKTRHLSSGTGTAIWQYVFIWLNLIVHGSLLFTCLLIRKLCLIVTQSLSSLIDRATASQEVKGAVRSAKSGHELVYKRTLLLYLFKFLTLGELLNWPLSIKSQIFKLNVLFGCWIPNLMLNR